MPVLATALIPAFHYYSSPPVPSADALPAVARFETPRISLNDATLEDLVALPGIGTKFAERFLSDRPPGGFVSWEQVDAMKGVGPSRLKQLQERFVLSP